MARKALIILLSVATALEILFPVGGFFAPEKALAAFGVAPTADTLFLTFVLAWCLLLVTILVGLTLRLVLQRRPLGWTLSWILGLWWVGIGLGLFLVYGKVENLFLDAVKGACICAAAWASRREAGEKDL